MTRAALPRAERLSDAGDTMLAWERFLSGHPRAVAPACNFVVSSWQRSLALGVNPTTRTAPLLARGDALHDLRLRNADLLEAASGVFAELTELFAGARSILLLTDRDGVVLEAVGDLHTLEQGRDIHLMPGAAWSEGVIGTNGIGTALAMGRPAQVHAVEHFCESIKRWTCAAAPVYEPGTGAILGVVDVSGPPATYQRNNLALAVTTARQIEAVLAERMAQERAHLLEACLQRVSAADAAGLVAIDRAGRLVHSTGRIATPIALGERVPGLDAAVPVAEWAGRLPLPWRAEWFQPVGLAGREIGALLVVPHKPKASASASASAGAGAGAGAAAGRGGAPVGDPFAAIIGRSPAMLAAVARARQLAPHRVPVLIEGETGVGKELFARALHGVDAQRPFIAFNCGAASRELIAGELFGHVRGAFTGATSEGRPGRFELAHQGTLCLDEIGELPLELQPVLLRVLEEGVVYRLGDAQPRTVDIRLIAVTNRDLRAEVAAGRFRRDLYHRIGVTVLTVPKLRDRAGDIDLLVAHFNAKLAARHGVAPRSFPAEVLAALRARPWSGNVRELRNMVESLLLTGEDPVVTLAEVGGEAAILAPAAAEAGAAPPGGPGSLEDVEHATIARALREARGNMAGAARLLRISRSTLYRKLGRRDEGGRPSAETDAPPP
jgi:transcriptional regulator of acetoin/glycerol metabolism